MGIGRRESESRKGKEKLEKVVHRKGVLVGHLQESFPHLFQAYMTARETVSA